MNSNIKTSLCTKIIREEDLICRCSKFDKKNCLISNIIKVSLTLTKCLIFSPQSYMNNFDHNLFCLSETFNTNISHQIFYYKIAFVNLQYENTKSKDNFELRTGLNTRFNDFGYTKINLIQKYVLHFS